MIRIESKSHNTHFTCSAISPWSTEHCDPSVKLAPHNPALQFLPSCTCCRLSFPQVPVLLESWASRCLDTACLETLWTQLPGWNPPASVRRKGEESFSRGQNTGSNAQWGGAKDECDHEQPFMLGWLWPCVYPVLATFASIAVYLSLDSSFLLDFKLFPDV